MFGSTLLVAAGNDTTESVTVALDAAFDDTMLHVEGHTDFDDQTIGSAPGIVYLDQTEEAIIFLRVYKLNDVEGSVPYTVNITQGPADDEIEDFDWPQTAKAIEAPVGSETTIEELILRDDDWLSVEVVEGKTFNVAIEFPHNSGDLNLQVYDGTSVPPSWATGTAAGDARLATRRSTSPRNHVRAHW